MRPSRHEIKQALLHPDRYVRDVALTYLQTVSVSDAEVLPLVIRAIDQYGWEAFVSIDSFVSFPQTAETLDWMVRQLMPRIDHAARTDSTADRIGHDEQAPSAFSNERLEGEFGDEIDEDDLFTDELGNFDYSAQGAGTYGVQQALRNAVVECDVQLLAARDEQELAARLPDDDLQFVRARLALIGANSESCWQELQEYAEREDLEDDDLSDEDPDEVDVIDVDSTPAAGEGENSAEDEGEYDASAEIEDEETDDDFVDEDAGDDLEGDDEDSDDDRTYLSFVLPRIEVIAREPDRWRDRVLAALAAEKSDARSEFLLPVMVRLAGKFRLEAATAYIVQLLRSMDGDWNEDRLLRTSCEYALAVIGTAEVATQLAAAFGRAQTDFRRSATLVLQSLRDDRAVQVCNTLLIKEKDWEIRDKLRHALAANLAPQAVEPLRRIILGQPWRLGVRRLQEELIGVCTLLGTSVPEMNKWRKELAVLPSLEDEVEAAAQAMLETLRRAPQLAEPLSDPTDWAKNEEQLPPERPEPIVNQTPHAGRNDPCPCGSGKKYKKCCWGKTPVPAPDESNDRSTVATVGRKDRPPGL